jgi:hypothetical protein
MILVLTGATGQWQKRVGDCSRKRVNGEIINADAFQVYQELTIATAAPTEAMKRQFRIISTLSFRFPKAMTLPIIKRIAVPPSPMSFPGTRRRFLSAEAVSTSARPSMITIFLWIRPS